MRRKLSTRTSLVPASQFPPVIRNAPIPKPAPLGIQPLFMQVGVGILCASYWRGMWYVLDDHLFPENPLHSALASLALGTGGMAAGQGFMARLAQREMNKSVHLPPKYTRFFRFGSLYAVSVSCLLVWRGAWMMWDVGYEHYQNTARKHSRIMHEEVKATDRNHLTTSGILSHLVAAAGLLAIGRFASVLAPPSGASILKDLTLCGSTKTWKQYSEGAKWFFK